MKRKKLTLAQHLKIARDLRTAAKLIEGTYYSLQEYFPKSSRLMTSFWKLVPTLDGPWTRVKSELDIQYHQTITDDEFKEHGHIYYTDAKPGKDMKAEARIQS